MEKSRNFLLIFTCLLAGFAGPLIQACYPTLKTWAVEQWQRHDQTPVNTSTPECHPPSHIPRIISYDPFIMHIENFVTAEERSYLLEFGYCIKHSTSPFFCKPY
jgi:hypothetical protein